MESEVRRRGEQESAATPCRPRLENSQGVENRNGNGCLDGAEPMTVDQCQKVRGIDDSQIGGGAGVAEAKIVERKRRGRPPRSQAKTMAVTSPPQRKQSEEEDVCFICFDGGSLVLCDRRGCPKAYHPACIKRDEAFFRSKAKWNCGWHICSSCQKASHYSCYTCTYSLCKGCTKGADFVCVRENKGFCGTCMRTIMLFENNALGNKDTVQVDFDDKNSWEYLFKLYWVHLKEKLFLTLDELTKAKNPWKENAFVAPKGEFINDIYGGMVKGSNLEIPCGELEGSNSKRRKTTREQNLLIKEENAVIEKTGVSKEMPSAEAKNWATKELLELVAHMKSGDTSILSYSDVQALLLDYITVNNLRDPHQMSQVLCDARLLKLFGKGRLGHFEMLKLLESHFLTEDCSSAASTIKSGIVAAVASPLAIDENLDNQYKLANDKRRKTRKRVDEVAQQINLDEYAAIDVHNIMLIFLKRDLMECLIDDAEKFHEKVIGCIVRIRISGSGSDQKQDKYRLVQVIGTSKAAEPYTVGTRTIDIMLEIRNLHKKELVSIDGISNQEFSEDECRWLRQCIKCGLMKQLTVGEIQKKAMALQTLRVKLWLDSEILRLEHLRDRANEKGHRKELRECVEKLQLLHSPEERQRRLHEIPQVHADPNMKPSTRFIEDVKELDEKKKDNLEGPRNTGIATKEMKSVSPVKGGEVTDDIGNRENDAPSSSTGLEPFLSSIETEKIWHYQDPSGKTHGPFSISMLKKWSVSGCFPSDLRIWKTDGKQDDSILLTDVLSGKYFKMIDLFGIDSSSPLGAGITPSDEKTSNSKDSGGEANREQIESKKSEAGWNLMECSTAEHCDGNNEFPTSNERGSGISCVTTTVDLNSNGGQNESPLSQGDAMKVDIRSPGQPQVCSSLPSSSVSGQQFETQSDHTRKDRGGWGSGQNNIDCNSSKTGEDESITVRGMEDENNGNTDQPLRQSWMSQPTSRSSDNWGSDAGILSLVKALEASVENKEIDFLDLTSPRPKFHDDSKVQATETKPSPPVQDSIPSWSTASSLVRGGPQLPEVAGQWKPSVEEWDSDLVLQSSFKRELTSDHAATPTSGSDHMTHSSPAHLATTISSWQAIIPGPVSDLSLADESVSDLLAEVEAMESLNGLTSPTSKLRYNAELSQVSEHDCFSPVEELSPGLDLGKNDALSSTNDLRMSSVTTQHFLVPKTEILDTRNISAAHSSSSSTSQTGTHLDMQHSTPLMSTWGIATTTTRDTSWGSMHGNLNLNNDGFGQGGMDIGYGTSQVRIHENASMNSGTNHARVQENGSLNSETYAGGNSGYWSNQIRYSGSRDRDFQGRDSSSLNNRGRASWSSNNSSRQPFYPGANGVNSHRAPPKGQRVCKFYGNGGCKKGASCNYWHPHP